MSYRNDADGSDFGGDVQQFLQIFQSPGAGEPGG
jgi:hypothetical protein